MKDKAIHREFFAVLSLKKDNKHNKNITRDFNDLAILDDRFLSMCLSELRYEKKEILQKKKILKITDYLLENLENSILFPIIKNCFLNINT